MPPSRGRRSDETTFKQLPLKHFLTRRLTVQILLIKSQILPHWDVAFRQITLALKKRPFLITKEKDKTEESRYVISN
jgi:hypothetical protein